jgi:hypothetical protein
MRNRTLLTALVLLAGATFALAQGWKKEAKPGPYRVVVTDPAVGRGTTVLDVYAEEPKITEALNRLDREGFVPLFVVPAADDRLVVVATQR